MFPNFSSLPYDMPYNYVLGPLYEKDQGRNIYKDRLDKNELSNKNKACLNSALYELLEQKRKVRSPLTDNDYRDVLQNLFLKINDECRKELHQFGIKPFPKFSLCSSNSREKYIIEALEEWLNGPEIQVPFVAKQKQLAAIYNQLTPIAMQLFEPLFNIESIGRIDHTSPLVSGDTDGSTARLVLMGIQAGIIDVHRKGITHLVQVLNEEAEFLNHLNSGNKDGYQEFQSNQDTQTAFATLLGYLRFKRGDTLLIHLGDGAHDRLSNNKDVDRVIRENMFRVGGTIFIAGNHDIYASSLELDDAQRGAGAKDTEANWEEHEAEVFCNAYYHESTNTLYLHHGIAADFEKEIIVTAFDKHRYNERDYENFFSTDNFDPKKFVEFINMRRLPAGLDKEYASLFTEFRPSDKLMQILAKELGIRIVHGHNGTDDDSQENVLVMNARKTVGKKEKYAIVFKQIGYATNSDENGLYERRNDFMCI